MSLGYSVKGDERVPRAAAAAGAAPPPDLWRAEISGLLRDLTSEVLALTEVVMLISQKLAATEPQTEG